MSILLFNYIVLFSACFFRRISSFAVHLLTNLAAEGKDSKTPEGLIVQPLLLFIWANLTLCGGIYCNNSGKFEGKKNTNKTKTKHWSWLDKKHHVSVSQGQHLCPTQLLSIQNSVKTQCTS